MELQSLVGRDEGGLAPGLTLDRQFLLQTYWLHRLSGRLLEGWLQHFGYCFYTMLSKILVYVAVVLATDVREPM